MRRTAAAALVSLLALTASACGSFTRTASTPGRAVVIWEPTREGDAERARAVLEGHGWKVNVGPAGVAHRTRSSVAIYAQRRRTARGRDLGEILSPEVGDLDVLPFLGDGPGFNDAVVWLADASR